MRDLGAAAVGTGSAPPPPPRASAGCCRTIPWCWWCLGSDPEVELLSLPCWAPMAMRARGGGVAARLVDREEGDRCLACWKLSSIYFISAAALQQAGMTRPRTEIVHEYCGVRGLFTLGILK